MFAQGTFDVVGEEIALIDVAAHLAHPATFAVLALRGLATENYMKPSPERTKYKRRGCEPLVQCELIR